MTHWCLEDMNGPTSLWVGWNTNKNVLSTFLLVKCCQHVRWKFKCSKIREFVNFSLKFLRFSFWRLKFPPKFWNYVAKPVARPIRSTTQSTQIWIRMVIRDQYGISTLVPVASRNVDRLLRLRTKQRDDRAVCRFLFKNQRGAASFPVVLGDFGCDVTCQACRENLVPRLLW